MTTRKPNINAYDRAVATYRAALAAHADARVAADAQETERARNPRPYLEWKPEHATAPLAVMRAEIAVCEATAEINNADPELATIKAWLCAALDAAADRFAALEAAEHTVPALDAVTVDALDGYVAASVARVDPEVARRERTAIGHTLRAVCAAYDAAMARVRARRKADGLPPPASHWDPARLPGGTAAPLHVFCVDAIRTRAVANAVRAHVAPDAAAASRREVERLEESIAVYNAAREADAATAAREKAWHAQHWSRPTAAE